MQKLQQHTLALQKMELALVGAGVGGGIKNICALKVLNFKKAMRNPDANAWHQEMANKKV